MPNNLLTQEMRLDGINRRGEIEEHYSSRVTKSGTLQVGIQKL